MYARVYIYILCIYYPLLYVPRIQNSTLICGRNPGQVEDPPELLHKVNLEIEHRHSHSVVGGKHVYIPTDRDIHGYSVFFWQPNITYPKYLDILRQSNMTVQEHLIFYK